MDIDIPKLLEISKRLTEQEKKSLDEILAATFELGAKSSALESAAKPKTQGRPPLPLTRRFGLANAPGHTRKRGRKPDKERPAKAVALYLAVHEEKKELRKKHRTPTDKAALENLMQKYLPNKYPGKRMSALICENKNKWGGLLKEGKILCKSIGKNENKI